MPVGAISAVNAPTVQPGLPGGGGSAANGQGTQPTGADASSEFINAGAPASAPAADPTATAPTTEVQPGQPGQSAAEGGVGDEGFGGGNSYNNGNGNGNAYGNGNGNAYGVGQGNGNGQGNTQSYGPNPAQGIANAPTSHWVDSAWVGSASQPMPGSPAGYNSTSALPSAAVYGTAPVFSGASSYVPGVASALAPTTIPRPGLQNPTAVPLQPAPGVAARNPSELLVATGVRPPGASAPVQPGASGTQGLPIGVAPAASAAGAATAAQRIGDALAAALQTAGRPGQAQAAANAAPTQPGGATATAATAAIVGAPGRMPWTGAAAAAPQGAMAGAPASAQADGPRAGATLSGLTSTTGSAEALARARIASAAAGVAASWSLTSSAGASPTVGPGSARAEAAEPPLNPLAEAATRRARPAQRRQPAKARSGSSLDAVEAVSRHLEGRRQWDTDDETEDPDVPEAALTNADAAAATDPDGAHANELDHASNRYRQLFAWLRASGQDAAVRELAQLRRVLLLAPQDDVGQAWAAQLLCPAPCDGADVRAAGASGQAWSLRAQGAWALSGPQARWQRWRMRQQLRADGVWMLDQADLDQRQPAWCVDGAIAPLPVPTEGEIPVRLTEPRRLRRLLGAQWTLLVLRAPTAMPGRIGASVPRGVA